MSSFVRNSILTGLICFAFFASPSRAQDEQRWYATGSLGLGSLSSSTLTYSDGTTTSSARASYDDSIAAGVVLGFRTGHNWEWQGELTHRRNDLDAVSVPGLGSFSGGDLESFAIGVNALYRLDIGRSGRWSAYAGPGLVYLPEIDIDFDSDQQEASFDNDELTWQLKLGGRYEAGERWFVDVGLNYLLSDDVKLELSADPAQTITTDYEHWNFQFALGLRF